jgi:uncharacterized membrane protein YdjX (TVP38/TMEM64 family)
VPRTTTSAFPADRERGPRGGKLAVAAVLAAGIGSFFYFDLARYLTLDAIQENRDRLLAFSEQNHASAVAVFIGVYAVVTGLSLPGAALLTLTGGFLFGTVPGALFANAGATTGAVLAFLSARYLLRDWVESRFGDRLRSIEESFEKNAFSYLLTVRLIPVLPFFVINLLAGVTPARLATFVVTTSLGIIPAGLVYAYAGQKLGRIHSLEEVASPGVLLAFTLLGLLALAPTLYNKLSRKS